MIGRRRFVGTVAAAMLAASLGAEAQQPRTIRRVAVLHLTPAPSQAFETFRQAMHDAGWIEGQTIALEYRSADGRGERLDELAVDIVRSRPDAIVTGTTAAAVRMKRATSTIPVVMAVVADPVGLGLVTSLARPGGNITGQAIFAPELAAKRLEVMREALPTVSRVALFWNAGAGGQRSVLHYLEASETAAQALGLQVRRIEIPRGEDLDAGFKEARASRADVIVTAQSALFVALNRRMADLALKYRLPVVSSEPGFAEQGGLMNYGDDIYAAWRRSAAQVDKILRGAKPGDLPVEQSTKFELVINTKTAKALGVSIPPSLLSRADRIVE